VTEENMKLWSEVESTDTAYTKEGNKGGHKFTSINAVYQFKMATKQFGPYGNKWGVNPESEKFSETVIGETCILNYDAVLYAGDSKIPIHASKLLAYKPQGKNYLKVDDEARKKVVTDAITKGLSFLGFNADVFMGLFEDADYVNQITIESQIKNAENKDSVVDQKTAKVVDFVERHVDCINKAVSLSEAAGVYKVATRDLSRKLVIKELQKVAERGISKIGDVYAEKKQQLEGKK
jgi:hypothetical protein